MNKQIMKLADEAGFVKFEGEIYSPLLDDMPITENVSEFAKLIIRECINMAESFHRHQYDFTGDLELHEFMKQHFGLE